MIEHLPKQAIDFDKVAIFYNTGSTNGGATLEHVKNRLERVNDRIKIRYVPTSVVESEMLDIYQDNIDPKANTIVGIIGGDGTIKHVNKTKTALAEKYPNTALWAVAGGAGQNLLRSSIEKPYWSRPDLALELGRIIGFKTVNLAIESPDGDKKTFEAVSAIGFNGTYHMIEPINKESHRASRMRNLHLGHVAIGKYLVDPPEIFGGLLGAPSSFKYLNEKDEEVSAFEILFVNTPRVAGIVHAPEVKLSGPAHRVDVKRKIDLPSTFVKIRLGRSPGEDLIEPSIIRPTENVTIQIDGDTKDNGQPLYISAGSTVTVSQSNDTIGLLELNLAS